VKWLWMFGAIAWGVGSLDGAPIAICMAVASAFLAGRATVYPKG